MKNFFKTLFSKKDGYYIDKVLGILSVPILALAGLLVMPFLARIWQPEELGYLTIILLIFNAYGLLDGFKPIVIKKGTLFIDKNIQFQYVMNSLLILALVYSISITMILLFILPLIFPILTQADTIICSFAGGLSIMMSVAWGLADISNNVGKAQLVRALTWALAYATILVIAFMGKSIHWIPLVLCLCLFLNATYIWFFLNTRALNLKPQFIKFSYIRKIIIEAITIVTFNIFRSFVDYFERLIAVRFVPLGVYAIYSVQYELGSRSNTFTHLVAQFIYPTLCKYASSSDKEVLINYWIRIFLFLTLTTYCLCFTASLFSHEIILLYAGGNYAHHSGIFTIFLGASIFSCMGFLIIPLQRSLGDFRTQPIAYFWGSLVGLLTFWPLVINYGIWGMAITHLLMRLMVHGYLLASLFNLKITTFNTKSYFVILAAISLMSLLFLSFALLLYNQTIFALFTFILTIALWVWVMYYTFSRCN